MKVHSLAVQIHENDLRRLFVEEQFSRVRGVRG
jgi:hypothetical protein